MRLGDEVITARAGDYVFVPRGTAHTYCNPGPKPAKIVNILSPADGVELLIELGALGIGAVDDDVLTRIHQKHSAALVDPLPDW